MSQGFWWEALTVGAGAALAFMTAMFVVVILLHLTERFTMAINEELAGIKAALAEASSEIVGKITELETQIAVTESVDPALLEDVRNLAAGLANIVTDATEDVVAVDDDVEVPVGEVPELPADDAPTS